MSTYDDLRRTYGVPSAHFDNEGNVTIQLPGWAEYCLGFPHYRRFVEQVIPRDCFDWDDWHEPSALWVHWRYAREAVYQFAKYYPDTIVTAEANPHFGQPPDLILGQMRGATGQPAEEVAAR